MTENYLQLRQRETAGDSALPGPGNASPGCTQAQCGLAASPGAVWRRPPLQDNAGTRQLWGHQISVTVVLWQVALILWSLRVCGITCSLVGARGGPWGRLAFSDQFSVWSEAGRGLTRQGCQPELAAEGAFSLALGGLRIWGQLSISKLPVLAFLN